MASLVANANISAQETIPGHSFSILALISSINSKPLRVLPFAGDVFSTGFPEIVESSRIEASQPCLVLSLLNVSLGQFSHVKLGYIFIWLKYYFCHSLNFIQFSLVLINYKLKVSINN